MENIFLTFFNLSINAGWLVLAVLLMRLLLKKAPKWIHCILWSIVGLRLLLPVSLESVFSLLPSEEYIAPSALYEMAPTVDSGFNSVNEVINPVISATLASSPENSVNPLQVITIVASYLWIAGIVIMCLYTLYTYISLRRKVGTATKLTDNIYQSENVPSPFILGVLRPKIYMPYTADGKTAEYVIAHERAHLKRKDHLVKPLAFLLLSFYWFNPLLWLAYILLCRDIELACDEKVVKDYAKEECKEYSYALLSCSISRKSIAACPLAFGEIGVKDRIKNVLNYKKPAFLIILSGVTVCVITALCFLTAPKGVTLKEGYRYEPLSQKTDTLQITTPENAYIFTDAAQIKELTEHINGITVNKSKTVEIEHPSKELPEASYVIKGLQGDIQTYELCISDNFRNIWTSEDGECQYLFTSANADELRLLLTSKVNIAFIRQEADKLIAELLPDFFGYQQVRDSVFPAESHYIIKESFSYSSDDKTMPDSLNLIMIYNCSAFRSTESAVKAEWCAQGVCEFDFDIKDGRVIYRDMREHVNGAGSVIENFGSTEEIDKKLEAEVLDKAEKALGIGITPNEEEKESSPHGDMQTSEPDIYAQSSVDFSYDIVPVSPLNVQISDSADFEKLIREKALNSSHLIRNGNKQVYDGIHCLIYRETDAEKLFTDYALHIDVNEKDEGLLSLTEVSDKYGRVQDEKDLYVIYIPDNTGNNRYIVADFSYSKGNMTALLYSFPKASDETDYIGYFAVIYAPKNVAVYENFTALLIEEPTVIKGNSEVRLSDIKDMNIGAEMPELIYCEKGTLIMTGTFGLIVYDLNEREITDRLDYGILNKLGIEYLYCTVSSDEKTVYLGNIDFAHASTTPLFTYDIKSGSLYSYKKEFNTEGELYRGISEWNYDGHADIPQEGYIYSLGRKHDQNGGCYLRAKADWSMKSLQAIVYDHTGKTEIIDIFK
ncbi:MAG: hypothetical protein IJO73_04655 [Clostridia bacterium]|nr:hypothetical protein [Clostridia bacterium]